MDVMEKDSETKLEQQEEKILKSIGIRKIFWPLVLGAAVVAFLIWRQFDPDEFARIPLNQHTLFWISVAAGLLIMRHLAYAYRLRLLSGKMFSWWKSIELIFIWEFSSAVSPTSLGGSAVALFMLSREKLSAAKTTALVIYTVILDTLFLLLMVLGLFVVFGPILIRPGMEGFFDQAGWGTTFLLVVLLMLAYGTFFFYGLFVNPRPLRKLIVVFTRIPIFKRYKRAAVQLGNDLVVASRELRSQHWKVPLYSFLATAVAWSGRFLILNALVLAFVENASLGFMDQLLLYGRSGTMFMIMAFSPTPGGSGFAEIVFGGFLSDFIPIGIAPIMASIWRLLTYYFYIFAGLFIIPNWVRKLLARNALRRSEAAGKNV